MKFEGLEDLSVKLLREDARLEAQRKPAGAIASNVRGLALDARFAGVVALIERNLRSFQEGGSAPTVADHPGTAAHLQGSVYALQQLLRNIEAIVTTEQSRGGARRAPDVEEG